MQPALRLLAPPAHAFVWTPEELAGVYREDLNLCVCRRGLDTPLAHWLSDVAATRELDVIARVRGDAPDLWRRLDGLPAPVHALERFDVALLKGESWPGNQGNGAVHRSPAIASSGRRRLILSIEAL
ncbi:DUF1826 domain-containing protein [Myxococcus xanthus]|uniref:DUF1826 domain-containing protein n=1 Tax=Myxococcus xanthus TaxID=34 RepID=A0A7Y4IQL8_MYXXA|nr:DUF1826 domain-containing protein [Myxococcus xanthus]NOJ83626.1 DUF1826 domain-containing protein [Myxococcus xanthus]NOJ87142.1 DUF1826 domain-containing protein [Myxococcus xanthus]